MNAFLALVWFFFAALFTYLAYTSWRLSAEDLRSFDFRDDPEEGEIDPAAPLTRKQVEDFNKYIESSNVKNRGRYQRSTIWYFAAAVVALISVVLALPPLG